MPRKVIIEWKEKDEKFLSFVKAQKEKITGLGLQKRLTQSVNNDPGINLATDIDPTALRVVAETLEDIEFEVESTFETPEDSIPFADFISKLGNIVTKTSGQDVPLLNVLRVPTWGKTNPLTFTVPLMFYSRTNSIVDVLCPALALAGLTVLKDNGRGGFEVPGVYLGNLNEAMKSQKEGLKAKTATTPPNTNNAVSGKEDTSAKDNLTQDILDTLPSSRFVKFVIPNLIRLDTALVLRAKPQFSKYETESGGPLWAKVDLQIQTLLPATSRQLFAGVADDGNFSVEDRGKGIAEVIFE